MNVKAKDKVVLRLERYVEDFSDGDPESRVVCDDLSDLSPKQLAKVLKKVKIDLSKTAEEYEDEASGRKSKASPMLNEDDNSAVKQARR